MDIQDPVSKMRCKGSAQDRHKSRKNDQVDLLVFQGLDQRLFEFFLRCEIFPQKNRGSNSRILRTLKRIRVLIIGNNKRNRSGGNNSGLFRVNDRLQICSTAGY